MSLFLEVKTLKERGFWVDEIGINQTIVEGARCPKCRRFLTYQGFANKTETLTFGVCSACEYARQFWLDSPVIAAAKKRFSVR